MVGKREIKRQENTERVTRAADEIFARQSFDSVTTAQIAERAGLTTGTFFRYATSKAELLITVYSSVLDECIHRSRALPESSSRRERLLALVDPIVTTTERSPENIGAFQREVLFGSGHGPGRERALDRVKEIEREIKTIVGGRRDLAQALYSAIYMSIVRISVNTLAPQDLRADIEHRIDFLLTQANL